MFTVSYAIKQYFFDRAAIEKAVARSEKQTLSKAGAFIRRRAISSLRRRKKASAPGTPPSVHSTDRVRNLKNILFGWEPNKRSVIVGMVGLGGRESVPEIHEKGKTVVRVMKRQSGPNVKSINYPERPTMGPALKAEIASGSISKVWKDSIRK